MTICNDNAVNSSASVKEKPGATLSPRRSALLALLLIVPAPSLGVLVGLIFDKGALGTALWMAAKVWLLGLPIFWQALVDKQKLSWSKPERGGLIIGTTTGILIGIAIFGFYWLFARNTIDPSMLRSKVTPLGLTNPFVFFGLAAYTILINSLLEEYVYRWFIFKKWETLLGGQAAIFASASVFVLHHTIILSAYFPAWIVVLGSVGVFVGGLIWSWLYLRYRSVWPPFLSHAIVDVAILSIGYLLIFQ